MTSKVKTLYQSISLQCFRGSRGACVVDLCPGYYQRQPVYLSGEGEYFFNDFSVQEDEISIIMEFSELGCSPSTLETEAGLDLWPA